jgi:hypothetical protein
VDRQPARAKIIKFLVGLAFLAIAAHYFSGFLAVRKCVERGGEWNYDSDECSIDVASGTP